MGVRRLVGSANGKSQNSPSLLGIKSLEAGYGALQVLFGVDIDVRNGELVVLIGPNGAGKSTALKSVFGLCDVRKGRIELEGKDIKCLATHELIGIGVAMVPQGRQVFGSLSVKENLLMGAFIQHDQSAVNASLEHVLTHFPILREKLHNRADSLSGGQQQMLAIGRAMMVRPRVLLMDEPSLGLAPKMVREIFDHVLRIRNEGTAILMVEQNAKAACAIADKICVLEEGKVALCGGKELLKSLKLRNIYLGGHGHE